MRKQLRKVALAIVFAMAVTLIAPAAQSAYAATEFTYAEQNTGDKVTTLAMNKGEKVDLKFKGVSDYKNYTLKWVTSNPRVAVVDSAGIITAIGKGVASIQLNIGDGTKYTSKAVLVYVDSLEQAVTIGTASKAEIKSCTLEMGKTTVLKANGLLDNVGDRYTCDWSCTDTGVAKISDDGVVTPVAPGLAVIELTVTKTSTGEKMEATPVALLVTGAGSSAPAATATPAPTQLPWATATPTPMPTATPTPTVIPGVSVTPAPEEEYVPYTVGLLADNCMVLKFTNPVSYDREDVSLYQLITAGSTIVETKWEILNMELSQDGMELRITPILPFNNGERYIVKAGSADPGRNVNISIGAPNRMEVSYECMGKENVAYAYDEEIAVDVPVTLSYRLYYGNIDVTESYKNRGYVTYDFTASRYEEYVNISDDTLSFYVPNITARIDAVYTYYDNNGNPKEVKDVVSITAKKLPTYSISNRVVKWTIIDTTKSDKIDWNNLVQKVVSGTRNAKLVVMVADSYGNYYVNDDRGVDKANKIYSIYDYEQLFAQFGYGIEFRASDIDQIIVNDDGSIYPFKATNPAVAIVTLTDSGYNGGNYSSKDIGICSVNVLAESKLSSVTAEENRVTLAAQAMPGYEDRFCTADVEIILKDQYGNKWTGDAGTYNLELSSKYADVDKALDSFYAPATLSGTTLHINAANLKLAGVNRTSFALTVTETYTNRSVTINVSLQSPSVSNGSINVTGWDVAVDAETINLGEMSKDAVTQAVTIEALQTSSNGVKVGLYSDLYVLDSINHQFTSKNCKVGDVYVLVLGPDGQPVKETINGSSTGVYVDDVNHCIRVNVAAPANDGTLSLECMEAGKYTVRATRIVSMGTNGPRTAPLTRTFTVKDNTKNITYRTVRGTQTDLTVSGDQDLAGISAIIESLFVFELDGKEWKEMNAGMIKAVDYITNGEYVVVMSVEFAVPVDSDNSYTMTYRKKVENINKSIRTGVSSN